MRMKDLKCTCGNSENFAIEKILTNPHVTEAKSGDFKRSKLSVISGEEDKHVMSFLVVCRKCHNVLKFFKHDYDLEIFMSK